jgi:hypothetical protein
VPGNTGDVNIVSIYASDAVSLLPGGGMRLSAFMAPEDEAKFMEGWNGTYNTNWGSDVSLWTWHAPKVTSRTVQHWNGTRRVRARHRAPAVGAHLTMRDAARRRPTPVVCTPCAQVRRGVSSTG